MKKGKQYLKSSKRSGMKYLMIATALAGSSYVWGAAYGGGASSWGDGDSLTQNRTYSGAHSFSNALTATGYTLTTSGNGATLNGAITGGTLIVDAVAGTAVTTLGSASNTLTAAQVANGGVLKLAASAIVGGTLSSVGGTVELNGAGTTTIGTSLTVGGTSASLLETKTDNTKSRFTAITLDDSANLKFNVGSLGSAAYTDNSKHGMLVANSASGLTVSGTADVTLKLGDAAYTHAAALTLIDEASSHQLTTADLDPSKFNITVKNSSDTTLDMLARVKRGQKKLIVLLNDTDLSGEFADGYFTAAIKTDLENNHGVKIALVEDTLLKLRDHLKDASTEVKADANWVSALNNLLKNGGTDAQLLRTIAKQVAPTANHGLIAPAPSGMPGANGAGTNPMPPTGFMSKMMKQGFSKRQVADVSSLRNFATQAVQGFQGAVYAQETGKRDASFYANQVQGLSAWAEYNHQSSKSYINDLDETTKYSANKGTMGISNSFNERTMIGASIASRDTNMNLDSLGSKNDVQSTIMNVFGSYRPENSDWYVNGGFGYSHNKNEKTSILVVAGTTYTKTAKPKSHDLNFSAEIGYDYDIKSFGILSPYVGVSLTSTHEDGYTETGSAMIYEFEEREFSTNDWSLGVRTNKVYTDANITYIIDGGVGFYTSKACKDAGIINYRVPGAASYTTSTINPDRYDYLDLNAALTMQYKKSVQTALVYHGMFGKDDNKLNEITARVEYTF